MISRPPPATRLYGLIGLMVVFWSANFIIGKIALREIDPLLLGGLRLTLAAAFLLPLFFWSGRGEASLPWKRADLPTLLFLGVAGVAMNQTFFLLGLSRTSVAHSALLIGLTPILVLLMSAARGDEAITPRKLVGMGIALAGVTVLNLAPSKGSGATLLGDFFVLLGATTFALFTVVSKQITASHGSVPVNTFAYVTAAVVLSPFTLWFAGKGALEAVSRTAWAATFYMALFPSVVCYLIFFYALRHISASRISAFSYLQPLLATLIAIPTLGERVTGALATGGLLVLSGVYLTERTS